MTLLRGVVEDHLDEDLDEDAYVVAENEKNQPSLNDPPPNYSSVVE